MGTGVAHTWNDLAAALFKALDLPCDIRYIDMPDHLKDRYQYFTQADVSKLTAAGYTKAFASLDAAVADYATYLKGKDYL